jgi:hypothetical protein
MILTNVLLFNPSHTMKDVCRPDTPVTSAASEYTFYNNVSKLMRSSSDYVWKSKCRLYVSNHGN